MNGRKRTTKQTLNSPGTTEDDHRETEFVHSFFFLLKYRWHFTRVSLLKAYIPVQRKSTLNHTFIFCRKEKNNHTTKHRKTKSWLCLCDVLLGRQVLCGTRHQLMFGTRASWAAERKAGTPGLWGEFRACSCWLSCYEEQMFLYMMSRVKTFEKTQSPNISYLSNFQKYCS